MFFQTTLVLAFAASTSAHMIMAEPLPFGRATLNTSPLAPADFPCKQRSGAYTVDLGMNQWSAGETKSVKFNGTAVHGGGSCQFSITTDPEPTKESQWKVIHSVEGNCLTTIKENYPDLSVAPNFLDPMMIRNATDIPVTMPSNIPDGRYTFAWTWLNRVGNREFYMNCAPIQVGSGSDAASTTSAAQALSGLPDMFVANVPNTECKTVEGEDFVYPDAGKSVTKGTVDVNFKSTLSGTSCATQNKLGAGAGMIGSPSPGAPSTPSQGTPSTPSSSPTQPQASEKPAASPAAPVKGEPQQSKSPTSPDGGAGGVFAPGASSAPAVSSAPVAVSTPQPSPPAAQPTPQTGSDNNTTPSNGDCTPCTNDGGVVCIGTKQFGLCNRGCAVAQDLAAGMACQGGAVVAATKRHVFPRAHYHKRYSAAHLI